MRKMTTTLAMLICAAAGQGVARADHDWRERHEIRKDRKIAKDDRDDLGRLRALLTRFDTARGAKDTRALAAIDQELRDLVLDELKESGQELHHDSHAVRRSERGSDGRKRLFGRERFDRRDGNMRYRDVVYETDALEKKKAILIELDSVRGRQDPAALAYRRDRIVSLIGFAHRELDNDIAETRKDLGDYRDQHPGERLP